MGYGEPLDGHVESIGRGIADPNDHPNERGLPDVNPIFTWVRLAQRIPVRIELDRIPENVTLTAGLTGTITIGTAPEKQDYLTRLKALFAQTLKGGQA